MSDLINRLDAVDAIVNTISDVGNHDNSEVARYGAAFRQLEIIDILQALPSAEPEAKEIGYAECANAMLKMWIDNVLTDGEYNRIMDKLNAHHDAERRTDE